MDIASRKVIYHFKVKIVWYDTINGEMKGRILIVEMSRRANPRRALKATSYVIKKVHAKKPGKFYTQNYKKVFMISC